MDILLFGGAFDPAHTGHIGILKAALEYKDFHKVIIMPTGTPGHKQGCTVPFAIRKQLASLSFEALSDKIEVSDFEGESLEKSYSYITVSHLKCLYPKAKIYFLIGGDSAILFTQWKNWKYLLENVELLIFSRDEGDSDKVSVAAAALEALGGKCQLIKSTIVPISSTNLRENLSKGLEVKEFLNPQVYAYIKEYNLYSPDYYERNIGTAKALIPLLLKSKRAIHSFNVEKLAIELAQKYSLSVEKARLCALLHDIMKEAPEDILLHRAYQSDIINQIQAKPLPVLHGFAGADFAQKELGITDEETLWAIRSHTCGRAGMGDMEKVIYLADMLCCERDFPEKDYLLSCAFENLNFAMKEALKASLKWIRQKGAVVDDDSLKALEYFEQL